MSLFGAAGERIGYEIHRGPREAPPILCVHGVTASRAAFSSNIDDLAEHFTVVLVELLGHGESDAPEDVECYRPGAAVRRIEGLIDHLGYERVLLCGHSLGGALSLRFALDAPERLAGLIVLNSNSAAGTPEWRKQARGGTAAMAQRLRREGPGFLKETNLYPATKRVPEPARTRIAEDFERLTGTGLAGTMEGLTINVNAWERLGDLAVPTLIVIGTRDRRFVENAPSMLARMPADLVRTAAIEGAGHACNLEQPAAFAASVLDFARDINYVA